MQFQSDKFHQNFLSHSVCNRKRINELRNTANYDQQNTRSLSNFPRERNYYFTIINQI